MNKARYGLIGLGYFGKQYLRLLSAMENVKLVAVADKTENSFSVHADALQGIKTTTNAEEIFSDPSIDAVFIITPPITHRQLIEKALASGKHVFVEKPMVLSSDDAMRIKNLVASSGKVLMVGYQYLFNDNVSYIKKEIGTGSFGKILEVESEQELIPSRADIDVFWDAGPHPLSIFQYLFNPARLLFAKGKNEHNSASIHVTFENAPKLLIITSCLGVKKTRKLTVIGEKATAILDETLEKDKLAITKNGKTVRPKIHAGEPLKNELGHFLQCVQTGKKPLTDVDFGCKITGWLEEISKKLT